MPDRKIADQTNVPLKRTVLLASDSSNSVIAEITDGTINTIGYSAYGDQSAQQAVATRLGFNGQLHETTIGWYLLGNGYRAYNPRLMRFHSPDNWSPFGRGGLNPYMYCVGDPVNNSDPSGHSIWAVSRLVTRLTDYFEAVATRIIGTAANTLNKSVSHVGKSAKKAFSDHLLFDPNELKKLGPPPPRTQQKPPANHVYPPNRYPILPSKKGVSTTVSNRKSPTVAQGTNPPRTSLPNKPAERLNSLSNTHTQLLDSTGNPVAIIRTGR